MEDGYALRLRTNSALPETVQKRANGLVEVDTLQYETFATLATVLTSAGWCAVWRRHNISPTTTAGTSAGIWDGGQLDPPEIDQLANFCQSLNKCADCLVPVLVLLDFPRPEHLSMARAAGARSVLPKPYRVDDLLSELVNC